MWLAYVNFNGLDLTFTGIIRAIEVSIIILLSLHTSAGIIHPFSITENTDKVNNDLIQEDMKYG
jgi:hypothetical protein